MLFLLIWNYNIIPCNSFLSSSWLSSPYELLWLNWKINLKIIKVKSFFKGKSPDCPLPNSFVVTENEEFLIVISCKIAIVVRLFWRLHWTRYIWSDNLQSAIWRILIHITCWRFSRGTRRWRQISKCIFKV